MNVLAKWIVVSALISPLAAIAGEDYDACKPVFTACAAQGYSKDATAAPGKKIWLNCAEPIIAEKKAVAKVDIKPTSWEANNCRDYRTAKAKFDADWNQAHQAPVKK